MTRRTTAWLGVGCIGILLVMMIPIGLVVWFIFGNISLPQIGNLPPSVVQRTSVNPSIPTANNERVRGPVVLGNLGVRAQQDPADLAALYNLVNPGTVSIAVEINSNGQMGGGAGSGFVITDTGYIATNTHVVEGADQVYVTFFNQITLHADVIGEDANADLAIIKVDQLPDGVTPLALGDSDSVRVGDYVVAMGNPFGIGTSMTYGIISAVGRLIPSLTDYNIPQAIQTDAAINPGNSGGPLINMAGEVIGINAQIQTGSQGGGNVGIGFAIPVNILEMVYQPLIETGSYRWPYIGVSGGVITPAAAQQLGLDMNQRGAYIADVVPGGPAAKGGIRAGDIIVEIDNRPIGTFDDLVTYVAFRGAGSVVNVVVLRDGGETSLQITLGERPAPNSQP